MTNVNKNRKGRKVERADADQERFIKLAYRLVRTTEPEEQRRLKDEIVRIVLSRRGREPLYIRA